MLYKMYAIKEKANEKEQRSKLIMMKVKVEKRSTESAQDKT